MRFDLNLMVALDALLRERSVSAAAARVGIGQPAMSAALGRLRTLFDDQLLVRGTRSMEPTPRAIALAGPLRETLERIRSLVEPPAAFDPSTARRVFHLSGGDYAAMAVLPALMRRLQETAPSIDLRFRFVEKDRVIDCLDADEIDVAMAVLDGVPPRFATESLLVETFAGVARVGHPILSGRCTPERFAAELHLLVTERGDQQGCIDEVLAARNLTRRVALTVPTVSLVREALLGTDLIATIGRRAAERICRSGELAFFELPFPVEEWAMSLVHARRREDDDGLTWLRGQLLAAAQ